MQGANIVRVPEVPATPLRERSRTSPPTAYRPSAQTLRAAESKSLGNLDETLLPEKIRRQLPTLLEGGFVERGDNLLAFGLPSRGKSHFVAALSRELILRHGHTVLFIPTFKLVQKLLTAKKALKLEALLKKLDRYVVVAVDIGYVQQDREAFTAQERQTRSPPRAPNRGARLDQRHLKNPHWQLN
jgi:DNA replication protein DnaC